MGANHQCIIGHAQNQHISSFTDIKNNNTSRHPHYAGTVCRYSRTEALLMLALHGPAHSYLKGNSSPPPLRSKFKVRKVHTICLAPIPALSLRALRRFLVHSHIKQLRTAHTAKLSAMSSIVTTVMQTMSAAITAVASPSPTCYHE